MFWKGAPLCRCSGISAEWGREQAVGPPFVEERKRLPRSGAFFNEINPFGICEIPLRGVKYGFAM